MNIHPSRQAYVEEEHGAVSFFSFIIRAFFAMSPGRKLHVLCKMSGRMVVIAHEADSNV
jgi:hypothetical protein